MTNDITEALRTLGLKSKEAAVLSFLIKNRDHYVTQFDIEKALELRQPYVSSALRTIEHHDWVDVSLKMKKSGAFGRPENQYQLKVTPAQIASDLKEDYIDRIDILKKSYKVITTAIST